MPAIEAGPLGEGEGFGIVVAGCGEGDGGGVGAGERDGLAVGSGVGEAAGNPPMANAPSAKTAIAATPMMRPSGPVRRRPGRGVTVARVLGRLLAGPRCDRRRLATNRWYVLGRRRSRRVLVRLGPDSRTVRQGTGNGGGRGRLVRSYGLRTRPRGLPRVTFAPLARRTGGRTFPEADGGQVMAGPLPRSFNAPEIGRAHV